MLCRHTSSLLLPLQSWCFPWRNLPWLSAIHDLDIQIFACLALPHCFPLFFYLNLSFRRASPSLVSSLPDDFSASYPTILCLLMHFLHSFKHRMLSSLFSSLNLTCFQSSAQTVWPFKDLSLFSNSQWSLYKEKVTVPLGTYLQSIICSLIFVLWPLFFFSSPTRWKVS